MEGGSRERQIGMKEEMVDRKGMKNVGGVDEGFERKHRHVCSTRLEQIYSVFTCTLTTGWHTASKRGIWFTLHGQTLLMLTLQAGKCTQIIKSKIKDYNITAFSNTHFPFSFTTAKYWKKILVFKCWTPFQTQLLLIYSILPCRNKNNILRSWNVGN